VENKKKPTRQDLRLGALVKTQGLIDPTPGPGIDVNDQLGNVIKMGEYGNILIEYLTQFDKRLHAGHKNIGKLGFCLYVPLDSIQEVIPDELAAKIIAKEVIPYRASKDLLRIFRRMKFESSEEFLDISYFDVDKENMEVLTYLPAKKFEGDPDSKKGRQSMKVGRILRKLKPKLTDPQIEDLVNTYRMAFKIIILGEGKNLDVVTGEDIRYWYSNEHYDPSGRGGSELWNSCMSSPGCGKYFDLYCENPDKIALCVYTNEDDKLMARALIWRLDDGGIYMDRIYAVNAAEKKILQEYAKKNGMTSYNAQDAKGRMEVTLKRDYSRERDLPYRDTFRNFNGKKVCR
jgi:hypothetical protein